MAEPFAPCLMIQGTASSAGKSTLVAGFCRLLARQGLRVAPFKAQNMALNAAVTADGLEIGRAQAMQAEAAGVEARVEMNPILLKPEPGMQAQVVRMGRPLGRMPAREYWACRETLRQDVRHCLEILRREYDVVIIEGAGSPAEINLAEQDLANMWTARAADAPVLLVGDIDRGGVFAAFAGTLALLPEADRRRIRGMIINRFRGDPDLLAPGPDMLAARTGVPVLGVVPWLADLRLPDEDSVALGSRPAGPRGRGVPILVLRLPQLANYDEFLTLEHHPGVDLHWSDDPAAVAAAALVIVPGSKAVVHDLAWLRARGLARALGQRAQAGGAILGICGGYQMLGRQIADPEAVESAHAVVPGLDLLPVETRFRPGKETHQRQLRAAADTWLAPAGALLHGYEIHAGVVTVSAGERSLWAGAEDGQPEGCLKGSVAGTLMHGLFDNDSLRGHVLAGLGVADSQDAATAFPEYDRLADTLEVALDWHRIAPLLPGLSLWGAA